MSDAVPKGQVLETAQPTAVPEIPLQLAALWDRGAEFLGCPVVILGARDDMDFGAEILLRRSQMQAALAL